MKHISKVLAMLLAITLCLTTLLPNLTVNVEAAEEYLWPVKDQVAITKNRHYQSGHTAIDIPGSYDVCATKSGYVDTLYLGCNRDANVNHTSSTCSPVKYTWNGKNGYTKTTGIFTPNLVPNIVCNNGFGVGVILEHDDDSGTSQYAHLAYVEQWIIDGVLKGEKVWIQQGTVIGKSGDHGAAYGAHLHFYLMNSDNKSINNNPLYHEDGSKWYSSGISYSFNYNVNNLPVPTLSNESTLNGYYYVTRADGTGVWTNPSSVPSEYFTRNVVDLNYGEVIYLSSKGTTSSSGKTWARIADKYGIWDYAGVNGISIPGDYIYFGHLTAVTTGKYHVSDRFSGSPTMYKTASKSSASVGTVPKNVTLNVTKIEYDSSGIGYAYCTYNGVSGYIPIGFLNYGEASGSSSSTTTVTAKWSTYSAKHSVGETNATLAGTLTLTGTTAPSVTKIGIDLYDSTGDTKLASKEEDNKTTSGSTVNMWYNVNSELGYTLKAGTTYKYKFHAIINGKTYYSDWLTVKTTGTSTQTYTITYNANGGSNPPSAQTKTHGVTLTLSSTKPTRAGYTFLGWSTSSSATSATYSAGSSFTTNANTTLYAVWKANTYTVSYNANGGSNPPSAQTKTHGVTLTLSSTKPTRTGYTFLGWSTSSTATSATYSAGGSFTTNANTALYAVWSQNEILPTPTDMSAYVTVSKTKVSVDGTIEVDVYYTGKMQSLYTTPILGDNFELVSCRWLINEDDIYPASIVMKNVSMQTCEAAVGLDEPAEFDNYKVCRYVYKAVSEGTSQIGAVVKASAIGNKVSVIIPTSPVTVTVSKYLPGDFNDDGVVTLDDAIYLLYYTFNPDGYPLNQPGDFNHDGIITLDDAIYLLYYTFNPTGYPLS